MAAASASCFDLRNSSARRVAAKADSLTSAAFWVTALGGGVCASGGAGGGNSICCAAAPIFAVRVRFFTAAFGTTAALPNTIPVPAGAAKPVDPLCAITGVP